MAYSASTWAKVKADYESGNLTIGKLVKKWCISETAIVNKIAEEEWEKGKHKAVIQQTIAEKNIEAFAKANCTHQDVVDRLAKKILDDDKFLPYLQEYNKMVGAHAPVKKEIAGKDGSPLIPPDLSSKEIKDKIKSFIADDNSKAD